MKLHRLIFYVFLVCLPFQSRILYNPGSAYVSWYFNYHLAYFFYLTDVLLITCFTVWLFVDRPKITKTRVFGLLVAFLGICLVSMFHVKHLGLALYQTLKWLELSLLLLYLSVELKEEASFHLTATLLYISGVAQALLGLIQFHVQLMIGLKVLGEYIAPLGTAGLATIDTTAGKVIRAYGTMPHPNVLGAFLLLSFILGVYLVSRETNRRRIFLLALGLILILIGIFLTFSRAAWLASLIAGICFLGYFIYSRQKTAMVTLFLVAIVSCGTIVGIYRNDLQARISDSNETSINDRGFFDKIGLDLIKRFPVLGVGVGNYVEAQKDLYQLEPWQYQPAHNIFIFIGSELGLLGLGIFLMLLYELFRRLKNIVWNNFSLSMVLVATLFLLMGQLDHYFVTIQQGRLMFAVVLGLLAALPNPSEQITNDRL